MNNKILTSIVFYSLLSICIPKYLISTTNIVNKSNVQENHDTFIEEFVEKINSKKVAYDGNTLTLCANPSLKCIAFNAGLAAFAAIWLGLTTNAPNTLQEKVLWSTIPTAISTFFLIRTINNIIDKPGANPFIKINSNEMEIYDEKIKLSDLDSFKTETIASYFSILNIEVFRDTTFKLFDKYLNTVLQIKNGEMLPISLENFKSIMQHYLDMSKANEKNQVS